MALFNDGTVVLETDASDADLTLTKFRMEERLKVALQYDFSF